MTVRIDTHVLLWLIDDVSRLPPLATVEAKRNRVLVSVASAWEIAIKIGLGNLSLSVPLDRPMDVELPRFDVQLLAIRTEHLARIVSRPHQCRDPSDRLIVAEALVENVPVLSVDPGLDAYGVARIW